jgi:hypothetical protein
MAAHLSQRLKACLAENKLAGGSSQLKLYQP